MVKAITTDIINVINYYSIFYGDKFFKIICISSP